MELNETSGYYEMDGLLSAIFKDLQVKNLDNLGRFCVSNVFQKMWSFFDLEGIRTNLANFGLISSTMSHGFFKIFDTLIRVS